jgi:large subunit ribosomal protein L53
MITRFLTDVRVTFNPFSLRSKPARLFLSLIPPNARSDGMKVESKMLPRTSKEPASLAVKFSMRNLLHHPTLSCCTPQANLSLRAEDGKEMQLDLDKMRITDVMEQVDRHSRQLARKEELSGN